MLRPGYPPYYPPPVAPVAGLYFSFCVDRNQNLSSCVICLKSSHRAGRAMSIAEACARAASGTAGETVQERKTMSEVLAFHFCRFITCWWLDFIMLNFSFGNEEFPIDLSFLEG